MTTVLSMRRVNFATVFDATLRRLQQVSVTAQKSAFVVAPLNNCRCLMGQLFGAMLLLLTVLVDDYDSGKFEADYYLLD